MIKSMTPKVAEFALRISETEARAIELLQRHVDAYQRGRNRVLLLAGLRPLMQTRDDRATVSEYIDHVVRLAGGAPNKQGVWH